MDDVTADLLISELDAMEAVDREWEDGSVSDLDLDAIERTRIRAASMKGRLSYSEAAALAAEVRALRERVATLEGGIREHRDENHRLDSEGDHVRRELDRGSADIILWRLLDVQGDTPTVGEMAGSFEGGPDSVEWIRQQRGDTEGR